MYGRLFRNDMMASRTLVRVGTLESVGPRWEHVLLSEVRCCCQGGGVCDGKGSARHKLVHEHLTGPWEVTEAVLPRLSYIATMNGRPIRRRRASAANIKTIHSCPDDLRHDFGDEFAHLAWDVDFGLAEPWTVASPMYTLID